MTDADYRSEVSKQSYEAGFAAAAAGSKGKKAEKDENKARDLCIVGTQTPD